MPEARRAETRRATESQRRMVNPRLLLLVSCRHCLRPITLAAGMADLELGRLEEHLRDCVIGEAGRGTGASEDVLGHFRIVGDQE